MDSEGEEFFIFMVFIFVFLEERNFHRVEFEELSHIVRNLSGGVVVSV